MNTDDKILFDWGLTDMRFPLVMYKFMRTNRIQTTATIKHICTDFMLKYRVLTEKQDKLRILCVESDEHWNQTYIEIDRLFKAWQTALMAMSGKNFNYKPFYRRWKFVPAIIENGKIITPGIWQIESN